MMNASQEKQTLTKDDRKAWLLVFIKGMMMGAVELVPGVSAGTLALITGVLPRLLVALKSVNLNAIRLLKNDGLAACWQYIDGTFLAVLALGLVSGVALLIQVITFALSAFPIFIWSFFFGLILASAFWIATQIANWKRVDVFIIFGIGAGFAYYITVASPLYIQLTPVNTFFAGMLAICAMILPGLSGSFILLLIGLYAPIIQALKALNLEVIGAFMAGASIGILAFSHVLSYLFNRFPAQVYALLTGIMLGSLNSIWPWQEVTKYHVNRHGDQVPMLTNSISPQHFELINNVSAEIFGAIICALLGFVSIFLLSRLEGLLSVELQTPEPAKKSEQTSGEDD